MHKKVFIIVKSQACFCFTQYIDIGKVELFLVFTKALMHYNNKVALTQENIQRMEQEIVYQG